MERATQTVRLRRSEKAVQTEEEKSLSTVEPDAMEEHETEAATHTNDVNCRNAKFNEFFHYKLLNDVDGPEDQFSDAKKIQIDEGNSVQRETRLQNLICVLEGEAFNEVCMTQNGDIKNC